MYSSLKIQYSCFTTQKGDGVLFSCCIMVSSILINAWWDMTALEVVVSVMVWGGICSGRETRLVIIEWNLTAQHYIDTVLRPVVVLFFCQQN